jgi:hypothetical protein
MNWKSVIQQLSTSLPLRKFYSLANRVPILGPALKNFSRAAIPADALVWTSIRSGPGKGLWLHLNPRYEMEYLEGNYEAPVERILLSNFRPGTVFYDVGAHIGVFSLIAARIWVLKVRYLFSNRIPRTSDASKNTLLAISSTRYRLFLKQCAPQSGACAFNELVFSPA